WQLGAFARRILNNVSGEDPGPFADVPIPWTVLRPVRAYEITVTVAEVVALGRAVLDYAPEPLPPDLADIVTAVGYRCNSALGSGPLLTGSHCENSYFRQAPGPSSTISAELSARFPPWLRGLIIPSFMRSSANWRICSRKFSRRRETPRFCVRLKGFT